MRSEDTGDQSELTWARGLMTRLARADSSLGQMFLVRKASMAARLNTSAQGSRISLAERSAGCQAARAAPSLFLMVG